MTFDPNVPNAAQSPGLFPAQNNTNNARLKTIINADHQFNDTAATTDGVHKQVTFINATDPASVPAGTNAIMFTKENASSIVQQYVYNASTIIPVSPIKAYVTWTQVGAVITVLASFNVSGVTNTVKGVYKVSFTTPFVSNANASKYGTFVTPTKDQSPLVGGVYDGGSLSANQTRTAVYVESRSLLTGSLLNVDYCSVMVMGNS